MREKLEKLLSDMVEIALGKKGPAETVYFAEIDLDPHMIRLGCGVILGWLRTQGVAFRLRSLELNPASEAHRACIQLVGASYHLQRIVQIRERRLMFADGVFIEDVKAMMAYAKQYYSPPIMV